MYLYIYLFSCLIHVQGHTQTLFHSYKNNHHYGYIIITLTEMQAVRKPNNCIHVPFTKLQPNALIPHSLPKRMFDLSALSQNQRQQACYHI